jgi:hypothetical protein
VPRFPFPENGIFSRDGGETSRNQPRGVLPVGKAVEHAAGILREQINEEN